MKRHFGVFTTVFPGFRRFEFLNFHNQLHLKEPAMSRSIGTTRVEEAMTSVVLTVKATDQMEEVARVFEDHDINAAPVIDESQKCVGIISSHDLVEFEAARKLMENELSHGYYYNLAHYGDGNSEHIPGLHFNEVGFHMTQALETVELDTPLSLVARKMCQKHIHHIVILDETSKPIGMVSSLDILGHVLGEPVNRHVQNNSSEH